MIRLNTIPCPPKDIRREAARRILLLDGGLGTMIQRFGLGEREYRGARFADWRQPLRGCNDLLCLTRPEVIRAIHENYLRAGSDIVTTDTFNANALSLAEYGLQDFVYEINRAGAALARAAADEFTARNPSKPRFVGGSMGPTGHTLSISTDVDDPAGRTASFTELAAAYHTQAEGLLDGGADLLMLETCFDTLNAKAAIHAIEGLFPVGTHPLGAERRSFLHLRRPRPAAGRQPQLLIRSPRPASLPGAARSGSRMSCGGLSQRGAAERDGRL